MSARPITLRQLEYAVAVADELSFRRAAERCRVAQPSLSAQLAALEHALGARLFERDRRRVLPTAAGRELIERMRRVLIAADDVIDAARLLGDPLAGTLRIGVIPTISPYLLPSIAPALKKAFPRLSVLWDEDKTDALVRALETGKLDAAVVALEAELGDVEHAEIAVDAFVVATPHGHPLGAKHSLAKLAELRGENVLLLDEGHCFRDQALELCERADAGELEFRATSLSTLAQMVAGGAGVTLLPNLAVPTETARARIDVRAFAPPAYHRTIALVWRRGSPVAASFVKLARAMQKAYPKAKKR